MQRNLLILNVPALYEKLRSFKKHLTSYFTLIQNSASFLCIRSAHYHTKKSLSFGQVNTALEVPKILNYRNRLKYHQFYIDTKKYRKAL